MSTVSTKPLATVSGTMLVPGVSLNNRLYTKETIGRAVARMKSRLGDPAGLPIVMRTHHDAGDNSQLIVGRITDVAQDETGKASYKAELYDNTAGRDIAALVTPDKPALRSVSIHGYWIGTVEKFRQGAVQVETADDLEIDAVDFTASPGVTGAVVAAARYETASGRYAISESVDATVTGFVEESLAAVRSKADLRKAIRSVGERRNPATSRAYLIGRARALGLQPMIPATWKDDGTMTETATSAPGVGEAYVTVCVGGDQGNIVQICVDGADGDTLRKAAKKAAKIGAKFLEDVDSGDGTFNVTVAPTNPVDMDSSESVVITIGGRRLSEAETRDYVARANTQTSGSAPAAETAPAAPVTTTTETESAVSETSTPAVETAVSTALTPDLIAQLGAVVGAAVKEAVAPLTAAKKIEEKAARKAAKKAAKTTTSETVDTGTPPAEGKQKSGKHRTTQEADIAAAVAERDAREKAITDRLRNQLIAEGLVPSRKGFRHVNESDQSADPTGEDLWKQRKEIFASVAPQMFAGTEVGAAPEQAAA